MLGALLLLMTVTTPSGQPAPKHPGDYTPAGPNSVVSWQLHRVLPPSPLYVGVDDVLRVSAASSQTGEVVTVSYRLLRAADAKVVVGQFTVAPASPVTLTAKDNPLAEGFLLSASCQAKVATVRGQTFARLLLNPKTLGAGQPAQMLMADYVTTAMAPGYPNGRVLSPVEGPGWPHSVQILTPTRGSDWAETIATITTRRRLISLTATLTTSATVNNRIPFFEVLDDGSNVVAVFTSTTVQAASKANVYVWSAAPIVATPIANALQMPLPDNFILPINWSVKAVTTALDVNPATGDAWTAIWATWEEWLENV
jgi:hypothetical protein